MTSKEYQICVKQYSDGVLRYLAKNIPSFSQAEDIVQESFIKLWTNREKVDFSKAKSYLFTTAHNMMLTFFRNEKIHKTDSLTFEDCPTGENSPKTDNQQMLDYLLSNLTNNQKQCLMLKDWSGFSIEQISEITSLSVSNVKQNIFRAKIKIKQLVANDIQQ